MTITTDKQTFRSLPFGDGLIMGCKKKMGGNNCGGANETNEMPGTDHVTLGPMRGLEKKCTQWRKQTDRQTDGHGTSMTESADSGPIHLKF